MFISCSNEEESIKESYSLEKNMLIFGKKYNDYSKQIGPVVALNSFPFAHLMTFKSDSEIFKAISISDLDDKSDLLLLLKRQKGLVISFVKNNKSFFELSASDQKKLLAVALYPDLKKFKNKSFLVTNKSLDEAETCEADRNLKRAREMEDHLDNTLAILTAVAGAIAWSGGILTPEAGAAYVGATVWESVRHYKVGSRIDEDYAICVGRGSNCSNRQLKPKYL